MDVVAIGEQWSEVRIGKEDLMIINAALNEVCNGIEVFEFETRMGASQERVSSFLQEVGALLDRMDSSSSP